MTVPNPIYVTEFGDWVSSHDKQLDSSGSADVGDGVIRFNGPTGKQRLFNLLLLS